MTAKTWWSVHIEFAAPSAKAQIDPADDRLDRLAEVLAAHDGVVSASPTSLSLRCSVANERHDGALGEGTEIVQKALVEVDLPDWPVVWAEAVRQDRLEAELEELPTPEVLGVAEVAKLLGVSRQRLAVIRRDHPSFPKPFAELAATPLWYREAVEEWRMTWARRPGPSPSSVAVAGITALLLAIGEDDAGEALARGILVTGCVLAGIAGVTWLLRRPDASGSKTRGTSLPGNAARAAAKSFRTSAKKSVASIHDAPVFACPSRRPAMAG